MAQSNLAREPSMDEILASIRKIIESNEATGPGLPANDHGPMSDSYFSSDRGEMDEEQADDIRLTIEDTVFPDYDQSDADRGHRASQADSYVPEDMHRSAPTVPLSLADVAARVRAASERQTSERQTSERQTSERPSSERASSDRQPIAREAQVRAPQPAPRQDFRHPPAQSHPATVFEPEPAQDAIYRDSDTGSRNEQDAAHQAEVEASIRAMARDVVAPHLVADHVPVAPIEAEPSFPAPLPDTPAAAPDTSSDVREKDVNAILSEAVSAQVSRSFGELALAIDSSPRRSFDEIAEEMLRPMLQEWLDDNLPTLVERLVREEIERVARGPRR